MTDSRVKGGKLSIDANSVARFFENRVNKFDPHHPLTAVLYQDNHPELAAQRDSYEKNLALPLLQLTGRESVLDVGCGIGRWLDAIHQDIHYYCGMDFSVGLIQLAQQRHATRNAVFLVAGAEEIGSDQVLSQGPFERIIIAGLMIYLNDDQLWRLLQGIRKVISSQCLIYIREPLALEDRLTLKDFWSDELQTYYSAIYRTKQEMLDLLNDAFDGMAVQPISFHPLYDDNALNNRSETQQFYAVIQLQESNG